MRITGRHLRKIIKEELTRSILNEVNPQDVDVRAMAARRMASNISTQLMLDSAEDDLAKRKHNPIGHKGAIGGTVPGGFDAVMLPGLVKSVSIAAGITSDGQICVLLGMDGQGPAPLVGYHSPFEDEEHLRSALDAAAADEGLVVTSLGKRSRDDVKMFSATDDPVRLSPRSWAANIWVATIDAR